MSSAHRLLIISIAAIGATGALIGTGSGILLSFFPLWMHDHGYSQSAVGLITSLQMGSILVVAPVLPSLIRRYGLHIVYIGGVLLAVAMLGALFGNPPFAALLAERFMLGVGVSTLYIVLETWVNSIALERWRSRTLTVYTVCTAGGLGLGPALLAWVGTRDGAAYLLAGALYAVSLLPLWALRKGIAAHGRQRAQHPWQAVLHLPALMGVILLFGVMESTVFTFLALYGITLGFSEGQALAMVSVVLWAGVAMQIGVATLADRTHRRRVLLLVCALTAGGAVLLEPMLGLGATRWLPLAIWGGLLTSIYMLSLSVMGERLPVHELPSGTVAMVTMYGIGCMLGPVAIGAAMQRIGPDGFSYGIAIAAALAVFVGAMIPTLRKETT